MEGDNIDAQMYRKRLKHLYKKIDSVSSLLWSHENHITDKKRLRSGNSNADKELDWKNKDTTQIGYGEIAMSSMSSLFNLFQNMSRLIYAKMKSDSKLQNNLIYKPEEYNMDEKSKFLDIGSGFGKPVFHSAYQVGCESKGIEVVPARVEFCIDFYYEYIYEKNLFEELEKKISNKNGNGTTNKSSEEENLNILDEVADIEMDFNLPLQENNFLSNGNTHLIIDDVIIDNNFCNQNNKFKIFTNHEEVRLINQLNFNELNLNYYLDVMGDIKCNSYLELKVNPELAIDENFINYVIKNEKINKTFLVEDYTPICNFYDKSSFKFYFPILKFENCFKYENISIEIPPIDYYVYSTLNKSLLNLIYTENLTREIFLELVFDNKKEKLWEIKDIVNKIENCHILDFINYISTIFIGKKSYLDLSFIKNNIVQNNLYENEKINNHNNLLNKDFYEDLKKELQEKEEIIGVRQETEELNDTTIKPEPDELLTLKEILVDLKFVPYDREWYKKTEFVSEDATICKMYLNNSREHFTHIYAYNKLMSKECRSRIAKVLNKTKFKILAWYSNPAQTKKAGLKNFTFVAKFPMQSTSTEKFHVYVYIKSK